MTFQTIFDWFQYGPGIGYGVGALLLLLCWLLAVGDYARVDIFSAIYAV